MLYPDDPEKIRTILQKCLDKWGKILPEYAEYLGGKGAGREVYVTFSPAKTANVFARFWTIWKGKVCQVEPEIVFEDILDWVRPEEDEDSYSWKDALKAASAVVIYDDGEKEGGTCPLCGGACHLPDLQGR